MPTTDWKMPQPDMGDTVLFSPDMSGFSQPSVGWVTKVGDTTISILTFTPGGFIEKHSVHHADDPAIRQDHGWHDLGCWKFAKTTAAIRELTQPPTPKGR